MTYQLQTNIFDTFTVDFFLSFAVDPAAIREARELRHTAQVQYNMGNSPYTWNRDAKAIERALCPRDVKINERMNYWENQSSYCAELEIASWALNC